MKKRIPKGLKKHLRKEKARIRREFADLQEQKQQIKDLYTQIFRYH